MNLLILYIVTLFLPPLLKKPLLPFILVIFKPFLPIFRSTYPTAQSTSPSTVTSRNFKQIKSRTVQYQIRIVVGFIPAFDGKIRVQIRSSRLILYVSRDALVRLELRRLKLSLLFLLLIQLQPLLLLGVVLLDHSVLFTGRSLLLVTCSLCLRCSRYTAEIQSKL